MSRLRQLLMSGRIFFVTCNLQPTRLPLVDADFACLAEVISSVRARRVFLLTGYVFMPDHWQALIAPADNDTLPLLMDVLKLASMRRINLRHDTQGALWQPHYCDETMWTEKQYNDTLYNMHFNPVERGLVSRPEDWPWSSFRCFHGSGNIPLDIDRLELPFDGDARL
jgi:putative transposase